MAVVYRSDIERVNQYATNALSKELDESQKLIDKINDFIGESAATLKGAAWDRERERFSTFVTALEKRKTVSTSLLSSIKSANAIMENYINNFPRGAFSVVPMEVDVVNSAWVPPLQAAIDEARQSIAAIQNNNKGTNVPGTEEGIDYYYELIATCEAQIAYINKMSEVDARAYSQYDGVISEMADLQNAVSDVDGMFVAAPASTPSVGPSASGYAPSRGRSYSPPSSGGSSGSSSNGSTSSSSSSENSSSTSNNNSETTPIVETSSTSQETTTINESTSYTQPTYSNTTASDNSSYSNEDTTVVTPNNNVEPNTNVENTTIPSQTISPSTNVSQPTRTTTTSGNSTLKNIGLATAGLAAAGAAVYGGYNAAKKIKENNEFDEDDEYTDDDSENTEINLSDDI